MADTDMRDAAATPPLFRSKKRKLYRQRPGSPDDIGLETPIIEAPLSPASLRGAGLTGFVSDSAGDGSQEPKVAEILRLRKLRKHRVGGVEFRVASPAHTNASQDIVVSNGGLPEQEEQGGLDVTKRFVSQTGTSVEGVDKHMMAYIDSELAKRLHPATANGSGDTSNPMFSKPRNNENWAPRGTGTPREPATLGKLHEIELVEDVLEKSRNRVINRNPQDASQQPKTRIGRNGKPYIPKNRNRRNSEDIRRDALVEAVLTENTLGYYEQSKPAMKGNEAEAGNDEDADEALAERFRREFMDAASERQRKRPAPPPPQKTGYGPKEEEPLKGPKLGGSRSARAAMREVLLKAEKGKK